MKNQKKFILLSAGICILITAIYFLNISLAERESFVQSASPASIESRASHRISADKRHAWRDVKTGRNAISRNNYAKKSLKTKTRKNAKAAGKYQKSFDRYSDFSKTLENEETTDGAAKGKAYELIGKKDRASILSALIALRQAEKDGRFKHVELLKDSLYELSSPDEINLLIDTLKQYLSRIKDEKEAATLKKVLKASLETPPQNNDQMAIILANAYRDLEGNLWRPPTPEIRIEETPEK